MGSVGLWKWYINIIVTVLDVIHRPGFYLKHNFLETGFFPQTATSSIDWFQLSSFTWRRRQNPVYETLHFK
jgi:hypothetical protein